MITGIQQGNSRCNCTIITGVARNEMLGRVYRKAFEKL